MRFMIGMITFHTEAFPKLIAKKPENYREIIKEASR